ncbi:MAG: oxidoreductase protein [Rhodospirillales bacterium]|nr:oxidoreductase protein [Rhodospirillales bacterium]
MKLSGSVCIVTGSATGVGAACAVMLAAKGARVVVNYSRSEQEARATLAACEAAGSEALLVQGDVAQDADCRRLAEAALERWGRIDGLINNAGITKFANPADLDLLEAADFHRLLDVNVIGAFQMIRAVVPAMRKQAQGAIVNVSSNATAIGGGSSLAYTASKGALNAMTLTLARVLGPEIRVNAVSPGVIDSRWLKDGVGEAAFASVRDRFANTAVLGRVAQPEDVAEPVVWLLEGADYITGEILMVDGGVRLGAGLAKPVLPKG